MSGANSCFHATRLTTVFGHGQPHTLELRHGAGASAAAVREAEAPPADISQPPPRGG